MASNRVTPFDRIQVSHFDPPITDDDRDEIICGICHDVLFNPVLTECGHNFCCYCLTTWLKTKQTCPLDSLVLTTDSYPDKKIERKIFNRTIVCSNDCNWRGCYGKFSEHLKACLREKVPCTFGCGVNIERKEQKQHEEVCERRIVNCLHCAAEMRAFEMEMHKILCLWVPITCIKCEKVCLRKEMEDHLRDECPEEVVVCSFVASGCKKKIKRREVLDHMTEATHDHLVSLQQQVLFLMDKNKELTEEKKEEQKIIEQLKQKIEQLQTIEASKKEEWQREELKKIEQERKRKEEQLRLEERILQLEQKIEQLQRIEPIKMVKQQTEESKKRNREDDQIIKWGVSSFNCIKCGTEFKREENLYVYRELLVYYTIRLLSEEKKTEERYETTECPIHGCQQPWLLHII